MITPCAIADVLLIEPKRFGDERGYFAETFSPKMVEAAQLPTFVQDNESLSRVKGTLRGLHLQLPPFAQAKLVRCVRGAVLDVAVDVRVGSPTFGQYVAMELSEANGLLAYIPAGFAHGFCTGEPDTLVNYKVDRVYSAEHERGIAWNDPGLGIDWAIETPAVLSAKDERNLTLAALKDELAGVDWSASA